MMYLLNQNVVITTCLMRQELVGRKHLQQIQKLMKKQLPQKKEISSLLASRREDIEAGLLRVLLLDECHLLWGDSIGYVWGRTDQEISIPISISNERDKQTYYGAVDYLGKNLLLKTYDTANSKNTIDYLSYLLEE